MKKTNYIYILAIFCLGLLVSCDEDTNDFVPELAPVTAVNITSTQSSDSQCGVDITFEVLAESTIYYLILTSSADAPTSDDLFSDGDDLSFDGPDSSALSIPNLPEGLDLTVYAISVNEDGTRSAQVFTERYVQPSYAIELKASYNGDTASSAIGLPPEVAPGFTANVTPVDGSPNTFDIDTVWGPDFVSWLCVCGINPGDYPGPVRIEIDPSSFEITILSGGEPSGQGYVFDLPYSIIGSGTYNPCDQSISLDVADPDIFGLPYEITLN